MAATKKTMGDPAGIWKPMTVLSVRPAADGTVAASGWKTYHLLLNLKNNIALFADRTWKISLVKNNEVLHPVSYIMVHIKQANENLAQSIKPWNECYDNEDELQSSRHKARQQDKVYEEREENRWILHLRTGIFYPKVPNGAAIFASNYWLRNSDIWNECYDNEDELQSSRHKARQQDKVYEEREENRWILHLRTGIFYPKVPNGAAIFASNYWLRNSDMYRV
nr:UvrD-like helicase, ATP-binding domain, P-loop containing nucleoside triphosphate hydrolase [Tanacetum cinerariifolium]